MVEVTLDSGACRNVMLCECAPGYPIQDWNSSRRGLGFIVGNGERVPNEGLTILNFEADNGRESRTQLASTFQVVDLTRRLRSVSQICEQGFDCVFRDSHAIVVDSAGKTVFSFSRSGQLCTAKMTLKAFDPFHRPS